MNISGREAAAFVRFLRSIFHNFYHGGFTAEYLYDIIGKDSMKMGECFHEYADSQDENRLHDGPEPV